MRESALSEPAAGAAGGEKKIALIFVTVGSLGGNVKVEFPCQRALRFRELESSANDMFHMLFQDPVSDSNFAGFLRVW